MSQIDGETFRQVKDLVLSGYNLDPIKKLPCPTATLPEGVTVESLERFNLVRFRFRGAMTTSHIDDFVRYSVGYSTEIMPSRCFIDADNMTARSVFNIGDLTSPGHADNVAALTLKKTSPYVAVLDVDGRRMGQKEIAEWLEDWSEFLTAFDAEGNVMPISQAAQAVRRVNIKQIQESSHEDENFAGKQSLMQSVEASSRDVMPVAFEFKFNPYEGLNERRFSLRNSLLKGDSPVFVLRIVQLEAQQEDMALEFRTLLESKFDGATVETFIGNFKA
ncbi:DUF2303 family protein [Trabulsiella odontotermitis]|uniref:YfdQ family protein n=1 Tax=Trabulsiella odontotermitis TaxID=379893 RepID=UPI0024B7158E|nr:DUF2303 family protein [Trabulsiella odontotermitis]WHP32813.1 DUF2303 family protein [Trabulsiella odontotermitis]